MKILDRLGSKLTDLLSEPTHPPVGHSISQSPLAGDVEAKSASAALSSDDFNSRLKTFLKHDPQALTGRVNIIGLSKIREKLGEKWGEIASRAEETARRAIERRLAAADIYTRHNDVQYLIIFAGLTKEQAQLKCALIAEEIAKRLVGEDLGSGLIEVGTIISGKNGVPEFSEITDIDALRQKLIGGVDNVVEADGSLKAKAETPAVPTASESSISPSSASNTPASNWDEPADWENEPGDANDDPLRNLQLVYRPIWDVKKNAVTAYECTPAWRAADGRRVFSAPSTAQMEKPTARERLDTAILRRSVTDLRNMLSAGHLLQIVIPVHFDTLAAYTPRIGYVERCFRGIQGDAKKYVAFKLVGVPEGAPPTRLAEFATVLRRHSRAVMIELTAKQRNIPLSDSGYAGVCVECNTKNGSETDQIRQVERLASAAQKAGQIVLAYNIGTLSLATALIGAGVNCISGDAIGECMEQPAELYRFTITDFYARRLKLERR